MELNPYASFLGELDPRAVIAATPGLVHQIMCELTPEQIEAPVAAGKWSPREIVAHLADCEIAFGWRLRQTLSEDAPVVQPFDQDRWARNYASYPLPAALAAFQAGREWNVRLIGGLRAADFARTMTHPERGTMTLQTVVDTMGGHDLNHLGQLQTVALRS